MGPFYKVQDVQKRLKKLGNKEHADVSQRFFKTGPGEYGEGHIFIGIRVPVLRKLAGEIKDLPISENKILLYSPIHEERLHAIRNVEGGRPNEIVQGKAASYRDPGAGYL